MLNRITIMPQKGCKGMSNARIVSLFKASFGTDPIMIRTEGRNIIVHTQLELNEKKFASLPRRWENLLSLKVLTIPILSSSELTTSPLY